jgi:hypothetical protein
MITAETLTTLTSFSTRGLERALDTSGYSMCSFKSSKFLGITNGGQFCYGVTYYDEAGTGKDEFGKVFLSYNADKNRIVAEF